MKIGFRAVFFCGILAVGADLWAGMDRWEVLAMRNRYAEANPETLGRPDAEAIVASPVSSSVEEKPTPSAKPIIPPPPIPASVVSEPIPKPEIKETPPVAEAKPIMIPVPESDNSSEPISPTVENLRSEAHRLAAKKLVYKFGSDEVDNGGLDCSATVQYLLAERLGIKGVPRTSYLQYEWLEKKGTLVKLRGKKASDKLLKTLSPGDLIFWGKTWNSGHKVSHVMIYMGWNPNNKKHYVFGARGKTKKGLTGAGVDVFELNPDRGVLVGHGHVPGLK